MRFGLALGWTNICFAVSMSKQLRAHGDIELVVVEGKEETAGTPGRRRQTTIVLMHRTTMSL